MNTVVRELVKDGYDVREGKILSATPARVKNFSSMGMTFRCEHNAAGQIIKRGWTAVTKTQALRLKSVIDPDTKEPYLRFAYVPIPNDQLVPESERIDDIDLQLDADLSDVALKPTLASPQSLKKAEDDFDALDNEQVTAAAPVEVSKEDAPVVDAASNIERKELELKTLSQLKTIVTKDLGLELPKSATKEELIEMILG